MSKYSWKLELNGDLQYKAVGVYSSPCKILINAVPCANMANNDPLDVTEKQQVNSSWF